MQYCNMMQEPTCVCVVDAAGKIVKEAKVGSDPHVLASFFKGLGFPVPCIGLEAGAPCRRAVRGSHPIRIRSGAFGDPLRQGSAVSDGGED
jgi:hypothetical protein